MTRLIHIEKACQLLRKHEGLRLKPYKCTADKTTIGYGRNLEAKGIDYKEAEAMLISDVTEVEAQLNKQFFFFHLLNDARKAVLIDMAFNLGFYGLKKFKKMLAALEKENFTAAAAEMLDSRWAKQVGSRSDTLSQIMRTGKIE